MPSHLLEVKQASPCLHQRVKNQPPSLQSVLQPVDHELEQQEDGRQLLLLTLCDVWLLFGPH